LSIPYNRNELWPPNRVSPPSHTPTLSSCYPLIQVYGKAGEVFDPTQKGGRYKPEFIWNTNWQETLKREEDLRRQRDEYEARKARGELDEQKGPGGCVTACMAWHGTTCVGMGPFLLGTKVAEFVWPKCVAWWSQVSRGKGCMPTEGHLLFSFCLLGAQTGTNRFLLTGHVDVDWACSY
jgi:hypothetical protein